MSLQLDPSTPFDLHFTLCCGQTFRWEKRGEWWYGIVEDHIVKIRQNGQVLQFENVDSKFVINYFGLSDDLSQILPSIRKDKFISAAIDRLWGLRILRQTPWECLISYICATYKNVPSIKRMLLNLSAKFGQDLRFEGQSFCTFPTVATLARASVNELAECGLGYRAKYVFATAKMIRDEKYEVESLNRLSMEEARQELLHFPGVGLKVADCVLLFSLGKVEAFPVDVWVKRAVVKYYSKHFPEAFIKKVASERSPSNAEYEKLNAFGREYFGKYAGYAQEYLYFNERT